MNGALAFLTMLATALLWREGVFLVVLLFAIGCILMWLNREQRLWPIYLGTFIGGPLAEAIVIAFGGWTYADSHFLGIPFWLPFIWGNAGVYIATWPTYGILKR